MDFLPLSRLQILETANAYYSDYERGQATLAQSQSMEQAAGPWSHDNLLPESPSLSELRVFASLLVEAARNFGLISTESKFINAVHRASTSASDAQAIKSVVRETLHLVEELGRFRRSSDVPGKTNDAADAYHEVGEFKKAVSPTRGRGKHNTLGIFLTSLARFYRALPDHQQDVWQAVRTTFPPSVRSDNAFGELIQLAAIEWEVNARTGGHLVGHSDKSSRKCSRVQETCFRISPWEPLLRLLSWGLVPIVTAENVLLSCMQSSSIVFRPEYDKLGVMHATEGRQAINSPSKEGLMAVASAVAKAYHSLGSGEDLSTVLLSDLLHVATNSAPAVAASAKPFRYHPMHFCRLVARLRVWYEDVPGYKNC